jgi:hypothetical protein
VVEAAAESHRARQKAANHLRELVCLPRFLQRPTHPCSRRRAAQMPGLSKATQVLGYRPALLMCTAPDHVMARRAPRNRPGRRRHAPWLDLAAGGLAGGPGSPWCCERLLGRGRQPAAAQLRRAPRRRPSPWPSADAGAQEAHDFDVSMTYEAQYPRCRPARTGAGRGPEASLHAANADTV